MSKNIYILIDEVSPLQKRIMTFIDHWVRTEKTPVPHAMILKEMREQKVPDISTIVSIRELLKKGFIRHAIIISNKTYYVMLRTMNHG